MKRERRRFVISIRAKQQSDGERRGEERRWLVRVRTGRGEGIEGSGLRVYDY